MRVVIVDSTNNKEIIEINENDTIKSVVEKIKSKKGINSEIILHVNGSVLEEQDKVGDYDIEENTCIVYMGNFRGGEYLIIIAKKLNQ